VGVRVRVCKSLVSGRGGVMVRIPAVDFAWG
jgi:hypothetical protein